MKRTSAVIIIALVVVMTGIVFFWDKLTQPAEELTQNQKAMIIRDKAAKAETMVHVVSPQPNYIVKSPLTVTGEIDASWFSKSGTFRVEIHDQQDVIIGTAEAKATGEEVEDFVPFKADLNFMVPLSGTVGKLVIKKANPSGDPEDDLEYAQTIYY